MIADMVTTDSRATMIREILYPSRAERAELRRQTDVDYNDPDFPASAITETTVTAIADRWLTLVFGLFLRFADSRGLPIHNKMLSYVDTHFDVYPSLRILIFKKLRTLIPGKDPVSRANRGKFFHMSETLNALARNHAKMRVLESDVVDLAKFPGADAALSLAREYAKTRLMDPMGLLLTMFLTGARLAEIPRARITAKQGEYYYSGVIKGNSSAETEYPMSTLVEPDAAIAVLKYAAEYMGERTYSAVLQSIDRYTAKHGLPSKKNWRKAGARVMAKYVSKKQGLSANAETYVQRQHLHHSLDTEIINQITYEDHRPKNL